MWFEKLTAFYGEQDIPLYHAYINTDIQLHLSITGRLEKVVSQRLPTLIPITESSASRTNAPCPHPLSDKLLYLMQEYSPKHHLAYLEALTGWAESDYSTRRLCAVRNYISRNTLKENISHLSWDKDTAVRFVVEGVPLWQDSELISSHIRRIEADDCNTGFCCASGEILPICSFHQKHIISPSSNAKLISYHCCHHIAYQGRFDSPQEIFPVGRELSFKSHTVLRRFIAESGVTAGNRLFVAWDENGTSTAVFSQPAELHGMVTVLGFTEASKGRISVCFFRYIPSEQYRSRMESWHRLRLTFSHIANAAFGHRGRNSLVCSDGLLGSTAQRLLGCVLDGGGLPCDILRSLKQNSPDVYETLLQYNTGELYEQTELQG